MASDDPRTALEHYRSLLHNTRDYALLVHDYCDQLQELLLNEQEGRSQLVVPKQLTTEFQEWFFGVFQNDELIKNNPTLQNLRLKKYDINNLSSMSRVRTLLGIGQQTVLSEVDRLKIEVEKIQQTTAQELPVAPLEVKQVVQEELTPEQFAEQVRQKQRDAVDKKRAAFLSYMQKRGIAFDKVDIDLINSMILARSFTQLTLHKGKLGPIIPGRIAFKLGFSKQNATPEDRATADELLAITDKFFIDAASEHQAARKLIYGISPVIALEDEKDYFTLINNLTTTIQRNGVEISEKLLTTPPKNLKKEQSQKSGDTRGDTIASIERDIRTKLFEENKKELLAKGYENAEDFVAKTEDESIVDLIANEDAQDMVFDEQDTTSESGETITTGTSDESPTRHSPTLGNGNPQSILKNSSTLQKLILNPVTGGLAGTGAGVLYSALVNGVGSIPYALAGGIGGAIAGAKIGGAIGAFLSPVLTPLAIPVGGFFGGLIGGAAGAIGGGWASTQITIGGQSLASGTGQLLFGAGQGAAQVAPGVGAGATAAAGNAATATAPLVSQAGSQLAGIAQGSLAAASQGLAALSSTTSALASPLATGAIIAAPPIVAGILTVAVIIPSIFGGFLPPNIFSPSGDARACLEGGWPTDGTIGAIELYARGTTHLTWQGRAIPSRVPLYGNQRAQPSGSAVDISAIGGGSPDIYSPYAGKGIAFPDKTSPDDQYGASVWVAVDHPVHGKFVIAFAHMLGFSKDIEPGVPFDVEVNQFLGKVDSSGNSGEPHLHYEVLGMDKELSIRDIVPNHDMKAGDEVKHDDCETESSAEIDDATNSDLGSCGPQESFTTTPRSIPAQSYTRFGCNRLAEAAKAYVGQLEKGFCSYYNQPSDSRLRSQIWNKSLYEERQGAFNYEQGGDRRNYSDMAWCTSLIVEVYKANFSSSFPLLPGVPGMQEQWQSATGQPTVLAKTTSIVDIPLGSAVFYREGGIWTHVSMVCDKAPDNSTLTICQANSASTIKTYTEAQLQANADFIYSFGLAPEIDDPSCAQLSKSTNGSSCRSNTECQSNFCDKTVLSDETGSGVCRQGVGGNPSLL